MDTRPWRGSNEAHEPRRPVRPSTVDDGEHPCQITSIASSRSSARPRRAWTTPSAAPSPAWRPPRAGSTGSRSAEIRGHIEDGQVAHIQVGPQGRLPHRGHLRRLTASSIRPPPRPTSCSQLGESRARSAASSPTERHEVGPAAPGTAPHPRAEEAGAPLPRRGWPRHAGQHGRRRGRWVCAQRHDEREAFGRGGTAVRYQMRQRLLSIGDDYWIEDDAGNRVFRVDGKAMRLRKTMYFEDADGQRRCRIQKRVMHLRDTMEIEDPDGDRIAMVHKALITPLRERWKVDVEHGADLEVQGQHRRPRVRDRAGRPQGRRGLQEVVPRCATPTASRSTPQQDALLLLAITVAIDSMAHPGQVGHGQHGPLRPAGRGRRAAAADARTAPPPPRRRSRRSRPPRTRKSASARAVAGSSRKPDSVRSR